ncbi:MAG: hypothetical protein ACRC8W_01150 [Plesiomonas shigelloides]
MKKPKHTDEAMDKKLIRKEIAAYAKKDKAQDKKMMRRPTKKK